MSILIFILFVFVFALLVFAGVVNFFLSIFKGIFSFGRNNNSTQNSSTQTKSSQKKNEQIYFNKDEALDAEYEEIK